MHERRNQRVLIVDDQHHIADTLALILEQNGYDAEAVYSGESAIESAIAHPPDVMISDVVMGKMNGIETAVFVAAHNPLCRIILFSGQAMTPELLCRANAQGHIFEFFSKPIHPKFLLEQLDAEPQRPNL
jgi:DNA-binding NtrC family response regulator